MTRLEATDLTVVRGGRRIVDGARFTLDAGAVATIRGASGSGKSTLLRAAATLVPLDGGTLSLDGREARAIGFVAYRRRVAYVPQLPRMFEGTVADNVRAGPRYRGVDLADDAVAARLADVGLDAAMAARDAADLSGGERLRVALARALANEPSVLLLDEPTASLDPAAAGRVIELLLALAARGAALCVVTHADEHAARLGGDAYRMTDGALRREEASGAP